MARKRKLKLQCPTCNNRVDAASPDFPFCSARCRLLDLGKWASGGYVISSPLRDTSDQLHKPGSDDDE